MLQLLVKCANDGSCKSLHYVPAEYLSSSHKVVKEFG
jgi:hypothetical protein